VTQAVESIVLFDGVCTLCNRSVTFLIARDPHAKLRFASLQSERARRELASIGVTGVLPDSIVLLQARRIFSRSGAVLRIARSLRFPWSLLYAAIIIPPFLRDAIYDFIARRRYRWFGRSETCMVPTPELRARFLSD